MKIIVPETKEQFEIYYQLRWEVLRKPWNKPKGSEKDELEEESFHALAISDNGKALGVIRLQLNSPEEGQFRYMGVSPVSYTHLTLPTTERV